jgi:hypothetical protein
MKPSFTLGIEEEYQTVDPETRDLRSHIHAEIIEKGKLILQERVKAEMHQSVVEVGTSVCNNITDAKDELKKLRRDMIRLSRENGLHGLSGYIPCRLANRVNRTSEQEYCRGSATGGAGEPDLWSARARGCRGSRDGDPSDESRTLLRAASSRFVFELAFLAWNGYGTEIVSL